MYFIWLRQIDKNLVIRFSLSQEEVRMYSGRDEVEAEETIVDYGKLQSSLVTLFMYANSKNVQIGCMKMNESLLIALPSDSDSLTTEVSCSGNIYYRRNPSLFENSDVRGMLWGALVVIENGLKNDRIILYGRNEKDNADDKDYVFILKIRK